MLTVVAFLTFDDLSDVLLVPLVYFTLETIEGQFITPILTGRSLTLNPVMIFLSMLLWGWLWGVDRRADGGADPDDVQDLLRPHRRRSNAVGEFVSGKPPTAAG